VTALVDDHVLVRALSDRLTEDDLDAIDDDWIGTTGCWYYRLCQAVRSPTVTGALSAPIGRLHGHQRDLVLELVADLPDEIQVAPLRTLAPAMADLVQRHPLNLLALEAVAAARRLAACLVLDRTNAGPRLLAACEAEGIEVRLVG